MSQSDDARIDGMVDAGHQIAAVVAKGRRALEDDRQLQLAVVRSSRTALHEVSHFGCSAPRRFGIQQLLADGDEGVDLG